MSEGCFFAGGNWGSHQHKSFRVGSVGRGRMEINVLNANTPERECSGSKTLHISDYTAAVTEIQIREIFTCGVATQVNG